MFKNKFPLIIYTQQQLLVKGEKDHRFPGTISHTQSVPSNLSTPLPWKAQTPQCPACSWHGQMVEHSVL